MNANTDNIFPDYTDEDYAQYPQGTLSFTDIPLEYVGRDFIMDITTEELIFGGDVRLGMIVLLEDSMVRGSSRSEPTSDWELDQRNTNLRWCKVVEIRPVDRGHDLLSFVGQYSDGSKRVRTYNKSYGWFVKRSSM